MRRTAADSAIPRWVEDELHNWARSQWEGEWPGPGRPDHGAPVVCEFPPQPSDERNDAPVPICHDRAHKVHALYEALPLIERRVIQAEYTRRREYGDMTIKERQEAASQIIGIPAAYYKIALGSFKIQVWRMFE
ncbi:hypothetical protein C0J09_11485 [Bordetella avium]|uniref:hypothetical protein n=1 Tax=Bordetella avium TaxID=521 RepID=UPI000FD72EBB|nr:hypothetical protein [Bordetella avium]AZY49693.1 hypothetical protein C0J09_11485 [Bordetella avium]